MTEALRQNFRIKIAPVRVFFFDQTDLPRPPPFFEFLLAFNGCYRVVITFKPDKTADTITRRETRNGFVLVLINTTHEIARHAEIQSSVFATGEKIDVIRHGMPSNDEEAVPAMTNPESTCLSTERMKFAPLSFRGGPNGSGPTGPREARPDDKLRPAR